MKTKKLKKTLQTLQWDVDDAVVGIQDLAHQTTETLAAAGKAIEDLRLQIAQLRLDVAPLLVAHMVSKSKRKPKLSTTRKARGVKRGRGK